MRTPILPLLPVHEKLYESVVHGTLAMTRPCRGWASPPRGHLEDGSGALSGLAVSGNTTVSGFV